MPVPATNGQLRTIVSDMTIGDYITCNYQAASGAAGTFSNLGGVTGTEIPVAGSATPNGTFYFVKAARGLLVADRVVQHTRTWDSLNTAKTIQGLPWDTDNIIPKMTDNTAPEGVASASSEYSATYAAWKAFDGTSGGTAWMTSGQQTGWISYQFSSARKLKGYTVASVTSTVSSAYAGRAPKDWTLEGSMDGTTWVVLDTQVNQSGWGSGEKRNFTLTTNQEFTHYRLNVSINNGDALLQISEFQLFEQPFGIIRSLTGGVAYADAQGNKVTTRSGDVGAWPTNNEWDRFVLNFPVDKIPPGKTVDDVFHTNILPCTWVQDTPILGLAASTNRVIRGNPVGYFGFLVSTTSASSYGFRPAFEYKE